ncbi:MAG: hypothetical protein JXR87_09390 [Candidatus Marinimicrobia bacterium]|nr:hypothetical protein [Candidatus Neomarinimicrobiota bacterium]
MDYLKHLKFITTLGIFGCITAFAQFPYQDFEIVESIPLETVLDNPEIRNTFSVWLEMINSAKKTIDIEQFYISNLEGESLEPIIRALEKAADRGVLIRIIAEKRMAETYPKTLARLDERKNISVRKIAVFSESGGVQHSKYFIVDNEQVFLGSQNFDWRALDHIHEIGLRIRHREYAGRMSKLFDLDWKQSQGNRLYPLKADRESDWMEIPVEAQEAIRFYATASPLGNVPLSFREDLPAIVELIDNAKKRIYVQLLSYSPSGKESYFGELDNALRRAAARGVDVRLLCSDWCQHKYEIPFLKKLVEQENLDVKLSTIPQWSGGYISFARVEHCKLMIIDDNLSWIGSSNWKRDYFYGSRNVAVVVEDKLMNTTLTKLFLKSWDGPYAWRIDPKKEYRAKYYGEKN